MIKLDKYYTKEKALESIIHQIAREAREFGEYSIINKNTQTCGDTFLREVIPLVMDRFKKAVDGYDLEMYQEIRKLAKKEREKFYDNYLRDRVFVGSTYDRGIGWTK